MGATLQFYYYANAGGSFDNNVLIMSGKLYCTLPESIGNLHQLTNLDLDKN